MNTNNISSPEKIYYDAFNDHDLNVLQEDVNTLLMDGVSITSNNKKNNIWLKTSQCIKYGIYKRIYTLDSCTIGNKNINISEYILKVRFTENNEDYWKNEKSSIPKEGVIDLNMSEGHRYNLIDGEIKKHFANVINTNNNNILLQTNKFIVDFIIQERMTLSLKDIKKNTQISINSAIYIFNELLTIARNFNKKGYAFTNFSLTSVMVKNINSNTFVLKLMNTSFLQRSNMISIDNNMKLLSTASLNQLTNKEDTNINNMKWNILFTLFDLVQYNSISDDIENCCSKKDYECIRSNLISNRMNEINVFKNDKILATIVESILDDETIDNIILELKSRFGNNMQHLKRDFYTSIMNKMIFNNDVKYTSSILNYKTICNDNTNDIINKMENNDNDKIKNSIIQNRNIYNKYAMNDINNNSGFNNTGFNNLIKDKSTNNTGFNNMIKDKSTNNAGFNNKLLNKKNNFMNNKMINNISQNNSKFEFINNKLNENKNNLNVNIQNIDMILDKINKINNNDKLVIKKSIINTFVNSSHDDKKIINNKINSAKNQINNGNINGGITTITSILKNNDNNIVESNNFIKSNAKKDIVNTIRNNASNRKSSKPLIKEIPNDNLEKCIKYINTIIDGLNDYKINNNKRTDIIAVFKNKYNNLSPIEKLSLYNKIMTLSKNQNILEVFIQFMELINYDNKNFITDKNQSKFSRYNQLIQNNNISNKLTSRTSNKKMSTSMIEHDRFALLEDGDMDDKEMVINTNADDMFNILRNNIAIRNPTNMNRNNTPLQIEDGNISNNNNLIRNNEVNYPVRMSTSMVRNNIPLQIEDGNVSNNNMNNALNNFLRNNEVDNAIRNSININRNNTQLQIEDDIDSDDSVESVMEDNEPEESNINLFNSDNIRNLIRNNSQHQIEENNIDSNDVFESAESDNEIEGLNINSDDMRSSIDNNGYYHNNYDRDNDNDSVESISTNVNSQGHPQSVLNNMFGRFF